MYTYTNNTSFFSRTTPPIDSGRTNVRRRLSSPLLFLCFFLPSPRGCIRKARWCLFRPFTVTRFVRPFWAACRRLQAVPSRRAIASRVADHSRAPRSSTTKTMLYKRHANTVHGGTRSPPVGVAALVPAARSVGPNALSKHVPAARGTGRVCRTHHTLGLKTFCREKMHFFHYFLGPVIEGSTRWD